MMIKNLGHFLIGVAEPFWALVGPVVQTFWRTIATCPVVSVNEPCVQIGACRHLMVQWSTVWSKYSTPLHLSQKPWHGTTISQRLNWSLLHGGHQCRYRRWCKEKIKLLLSSKPPRKLHELDDASHDASSHSCVLKRESEALGSGASVATNKATTEEHTERRQDCDTFRVPCVVCVIAVMVLVISELQRM